MNQADDLVAWPDDAVEVGRITDAWGIKGGIRVHPYSSDPQALFSSRRWYLQAPDRPVAPAAAAARSQPALHWPMLLHVTQAKEQGDGIVALIRELDDRGAAEALKGARIFVPRSSFPTADPDEFYWVDLMGLAVVNREGVALGQVADLLDTGAHSVLRVVQGGADDAADGAGDVAAANPSEELERLIPFVAAYVDKVDLPGRCITVDWALDWGEPVPARKPAAPSADGAAKKRRKRAPAAPSPTEPAGDA